jgi:hypothetical protein
MQALKFEVKSKDDALVKVKIQLISRVVDFQEMYYSLASPKAQKAAFIEDSLRAVGATMDIDQMFLDKQAIADRVRRDIQEDLQPYGIKVESLLLVDIKVSKELHKAMTKKEVARRNISTARDNAEAAKIRVVKAAEAQADAEALSGAGTAREREAMLDGMRSSIASFYEANPDIPPQECYDTVMLLQYLQTLELSGGDYEKVMLPYGPDSVGWLHADLEKKKMESKTTSNIDWKNVSCEMRGPKLTEHIREEEALEQVSLLPVHTPSSVLVEQIEVENAAQGEDVAEETVTVVSPKEEIDTDRPDPELQPDSESGIEMDVLQM